MAFWSNLKRLLGEAETSSPTEPVLHDQLTRHRTAGAPYEQWKKGHISSKLIDWLGAQYSLFLSEPTRVDEAIDFLDTASSKGFVIHFGDTGYSLQEAEYFQLLLRERVLARNYRTQVADTRTYSRKRHTERTDRYYLKPRPDFEHPKGPDVPMDMHTQGQFDQQFGNVMLELVVRDDRPHHLRFSATVYHDRVYKQAQGFGGLMEVVLGVY